MPPKKKRKKAKQYQPCCPPAPRRRRAQPVYAPRSQPQFYAPLPTPQTQFDGETVRRIVQDEFKRYHTPRKIISVAGVETQTDVSQPDFESISRALNPLSMSAAIEEVRKAGSDIRVQAEEQEKIEATEALEEGREKMRRRREAMESARTAFKPTPSMSQPEEEPRLIRGRYGLGEGEREE